MKRIITALFSVVIFLALIGCAANSNNTAGNNTAGNNTKSTVVASNTSSTPVATPSTPNSSISEPSSKITSEQAKSVAFNHAGVSEGNIRDLEVELDRDDGVLSYEIEFKADKIEYKYDIHAETGKVLRSEKDFD